MNTIKNVIVLVSFGSISEEFLQAVQTEYPEYQVIQAFTSERYRNTVREKKALELLPLDNILEGLIKEGVRKILLQPLYILQGVEFEKISQVVNKYYQQGFYGIKVGEPLLKEQGSCSEVVKVLRKDYRSLDDQEGLLLVAHGTYHSSGYQYLRLQEHLSKESTPMFLVTLMGMPSLEIVLEFIKIKKIKKLKVVPLMMAVGKHMLYDIAGHHPNALKSLLIAEGFEVEILLQGIIDNRGFQKVFLNHLRELVKG